MGTISHHSLAERVLGAARCGATLWKNHNLDAFQTLGVSRGAGLLVVLCPAHPAERLGVDAVPHVVVLGHVAAQADLDSLEALGLALGAARLSVLVVGLLPAVGLDVGAVLDGAGVIGIIELDLYTLEAF